MRPNKKKDYSDGFLGKIIMGHLIDLKSGVLDKDQAFRLIMKAIEDCTHA